MQGKIRVGVIGLGIGTDIHIPGFQACPDAEVVAICDVRQERVEAAAKKFGIPNVFTDYRKMLELNGLDAVSITTPPHLHFPMTMAALEAGKHIICEKPMALNLDEAQRMYEEAERRGVIHMINHEFRFFPGWARMKELIDEGYLGKVFNVFSTTLYLTPSRPWHWWVPGGGLLGAVGSHVIDALRYWFGEIVGVYGEVDTWIKQRVPPECDDIRDVPVDDAFSFMVRFQSGGLGTVVVSSAARYVSGVPGESSFEAYGSDGTLKLGTDDKLIGGRGEDKEASEIPIPDRLKLPKAEGDFLLPPFIRLVQEFLRGIKEKTKVAPSLYDGVKHQAVIDAILLSHKERRWVAELTSDRISYEFK